MSLVATISWDGEPDAGRKCWRVYAADHPSEKGALVAEVGPYEVTADVVVEERYYLFRIVSVALNGVEGDWGSGEGRCEIVVTGEEHSPSALTASGGAMIYGGPMWAVAVQPPPGGDPPQRMQIIRGPSEHQGQLVGEIEVPFERENDECGVRFNSPVGMASAGRGTGSETFTVRGVSEDGVAPGTGLTFSSPHISFPNMTPSTLASVVGGTISGFTAATETDPHEYVTGVGCRLRTLPTAISATTAAGWGTVSSGLLTDEPYGAYYVTGATITSDELDFGSVTSFVLECYDEFERATSDGIFSTLRAGDAPYPVVPQADDDWRKADAGPAWVNRMVSAEGKCLRPVRRPRWQWRITDTSPVTGVWHEYPAPVWVSGRYAQARVRVDEPMGTHQLVSQQIIVRAWEPWSETEVPTGNLPIGYASLYVNDGSTAQAVSTTPAIVSLWSDKGNALRASASTTTDLITVTAEGYYDVHATVSFTGAVNTEFHAHIYVAGADTGFGFHRKIGASSDVGSAACHAPGVQIASGQTAAIYVDSSADAKSITIVDGQFSVRRIR